MKKEDEMRKFLTFRFSGMLMILIILIIIPVTLSSVNAYEIFYYHSDHLGSPVAITNQDGNVVWSASYKPFGESFNVWGDNDYQYNAKEKDNSGLFYYGARYYDADLGRFTSADTVKGDIKSPQTLNKYIYTSNNPLKYVDPSGMAGRATYTFLSAPLMKVVSSFFYMRNQDNPAFRNMYLYTHGLQKGPLDVSSEFTKAGTSFLSKKGMESIVGALAAGYARSVGGEITQTKMTEGIEKLFNFMESAEVGETKSFPGYFSKGNELMAYGGVTFKVENVDEEGHFKITMSDTYNFNRGQRWYVPLGKFSVPGAELCANAFCALPLGEEGPNIETVDIEEKGESKAVKLEDDWMKDLPGSQEFPVTATINFYYNYDTHSVEYAE